MNDEKTTLLEQARTRFPGRISIAEIVEEEIGLGTDSVYATLCAEAYRMDLITEAEIRSQYGDQAFNLVMGLKTLSALRVERSSHHSENFIRLLMGISRDIRVLLIRMVEVLGDMRIADQLPKTQVKRVAGEAYYLYAPIAHRLGFYHIKTELEDRAMRILFPCEYNLIAGKLKETERERDEYISKFITPVETTLRQEGFSFEIKGRPKSVHSIWKKMQKQQVGFDQIYDLLAIRIILKEILEGEKSDCWKVYSLVTDIYPPDPVRLRDWVSTPKISGYEALHTTVEGPDKKLVEVQIRTARMDEKAERGSAAHWLYKEGKRMVESDEYLIRLRQKLDFGLSDESGQEDASWMDLKDPHIFIFTPEGDLKRLANGSSVLDFAFLVHSDIGTRCTGARVNGKSVPIKHILQNGDTVEIRISRNQKPKQDWLKFVTSPRARQKIRKILRDEEMKEAESGKELLFRKLKHWKVPVSDSSIDTAVNLLRYNTHMEFFQAVAIGKLDPLKVKKVILHPEQIVPSEKLHEIKFRNVDAGEKSGDVLFLDKGLANVNYTLAKCCQPLFGDPVFGFVTVSRGISVHRINCSNAEDLQKRYDYRVVRVKWRETLGAGSFQTTVKIQGIDQIGMLNTISDIITHELNINIRSASLESDKGLFKGSIKVFVKDQTQLEILVHRLAKINGVLKVTL